MSLNTELKELIIAQNKTIVNLVKINDDLMKRINKLECKESEESEEEYEQRKKNVNNIETFLKSNMVSFGENLYCPRSLFEKTYINYCKINHIKENQSHKNYEFLLSYYKIKIEHNCNKRYPNKLGEKGRGGTFYIGIDIKTD